ncbi:MAG: InlB B-repeat-containing protein [Clostridium sp.]|nr:InlB B-repeat-containing protein [Clostridium sp.]
MEGKKRTIIIVIGVVLIIACLVIYFIFDNKKYTITFDSDGGSVVEKQIVKRGEKVNKPTDPTRDGYIFIEWDLGSSIYDFSAKVTRNLILKAIWKEQEGGKVTYVVNFNTDGGNSVSNQIINKDGTITKPQDPVRDGYKFLGWYSNNVLFDFNTPVTKNLELVAKWEKAKDNSTTGTTTTTKKTTTKKNDTTNTTTTKKTTTTTTEAKKYTVKFDSNGGSKVSSKEVTSGSKVSKPSNPIRTGYKFSGWTLNNKAYDFNSKVTSNITLVAKWTAKTYTVKVSSVDAYSPARILSVYEDGSKISFKQINYTDGIKLCSSNGNVNMSDIEGLSKLQVVLSDGTKVTATIK